MSRAVRSSHQISLFPFLAVLVCAMGALIFLLLITTRQIRSAAIDRAQTPRTETAAPVPLDVASSIPAPVVTAGVTGQLPDDPSLLFPLTRTRPEPPAPIDRAAEWRVRQENLRRQVNEAAGLLTEQQRQADELINRRATQQQQLEQLKREQQLAARVLSERDGVRQSIAKAGGEVLAEIETTRLKINQSLEHQATASSKFTFFPYDADTGTVRRPILIECNRHGFVFRPENVVLAKSDFEGFLPDFNPLLAGAQALAEYWRARDDDSSQPYGKPYVLLLVRPDGTMPYYVARRMLNSLGADFGYELVGDEVPLAYPDLDAEAARVCREAVQEMLAQRATLAEQLRNSTGSGSGVGGGRAAASGRVAGSGLSGGQMNPSGGRGSRGERAIRLAPNGAIIVDEGRTSRASEASDLNGWGELVEGGRASQGDRIQRNSAGQARSSSRSAQDSQSTGSFEAPSVSGNGSGPSRGLASREPGGPANSIAGSQRHPLVRADSGSGLSETPAELTDGSLRGSGPEGVADSSWPATSRPTSRTPGRSAGPDRSADSSTGSGAARSSVASGSNGSAGGGSSAAAGSPFAQVGLPSAAGSSASKRTGEPSKPIAKRRSWGIPSASGTIGYERNVDVEVFADRVRVGRYYVPMGGSIARHDLSAAMADLIDLQARTWGAPPTSFYWVPSIRFVVHDAGRSGYERLYGIVRELGLSATAVQASPSTK